MLNFNCNVHCCTFIHIIIIVHYRLIQAVKVSTGCLTLQIYSLVCYQLYKKDLSPLRTGWAYRMMHLHW